MSSYITAITFPRRRHQKLGDPSHRDGMIKAAARKAGVKVSQIIQSHGAHEGAIVFQARNDAAAGRLIGALTEVGNVDPKTLRQLHAAHFSAVMG